MSLHIYDSRERALVAAGDALLAAGAAVTRPFRRRVKPSDPRRILMLRLERIGDLVMALPAIAAVRRLAPQAEIDLAVGSWNAELAGAIPSVSRVLTLDARWLGRDGEGMGPGGLLQTAARWRRQRYDLAINFEPDIRTNLVLAVTGSRWTAGYASGGGGPLLDHALAYDSTAHTTDNALRLVAQVFGAAVPPGDRPLLAIPDEHHQRARVLLANAPRPLVAMHVSGGRAVKQWDPQRFADVARRLALSRGASIVLTGTAGDIPLIDQVKRVLPAGAAVDASGSISLLTLAAILSEADVMITGDTGPMHLAAAVGTPIVGVFGPSDPRRYAPRGARDTIVRVDLPCAPCNRIRLPPARCTGRIPDCLAQLPADRVFEAAAAVLDQSQLSPARRGHA